MDIGERKRIDVSDVDYEAMDLRYKQDGDDYVHDCDYCQIKTWSRLCLLGKMTGAYCLKCGMQRSPEIQRQLYAEA